MRTKLADLTPEQIELITIDISTGEYSLMEIATLHSVTYQTAQALFERYLYTYRVDKYYHPEKRGNTIKTEHEMMNGVPKYDIKTLNGDELEMLNTSIPDRWKL